MANGIKGVKTLIVSSNYDEQELKKLKENYEKEGYVVSIIYINDGK